MREALYDIFETTHVWRHIRCHISIGMRTNIGVLHTRDKVRHIQLYVQASRRERRYARYLIRVTRHEIQHLIPGIHDFMYGAGDTAGNLCDTGWKR